MARFNQDFVMFSGNTPYIYFEDITFPEGIDLTDISEITWVITKQKEVLVTKTLVSGISKVGTDKVKVTLLEADTVDIFGKYNHELKMVSDTGEIITTAVGKITIIDSLIKEEVL